MLSSWSDEGALVNAAREVGVVFKARTPNSIIIEVVSTYIHTLYSCVTSSVLHMLCVCVCVCVCVCRMELKKSINFSIYWNSTGIILYTLLLYDTKHSIYIHNIYCVSGPDI